MSSIKVDFKKRTLFAKKSVGLVDMVKAIESIPKGETHLWKIRFNRDSDKSFEDGITIQT